MTNILKKMTYKISVGMICFTLLCVGVYLGTDDVKAKTTVTVGNTGNFLNIQQAINWVKTDIFDNDYVISVLSDYDPVCEIFPISIIMHQVDTPNPKSVTISGPGSNITINSGPLNPQNIFQINYNLGNQYELKIMDFVLTVQSTQHDVIYIYDSMNVILDYCFLGGLNNNYRCKNGIYVTGSSKIGMTACLINYCNENGTLMEYVNNYDNSIGKLGISHCDIMDNNKNGILLHQCNYIRCCSNNIIDNQENGMEISCTNNCIIYSDTENIIRNNNKHGIYMGHNGEFDLCTKNIIKDYNIGYNGLDGIFINTKASVESNKNIIDNVTIHNNRYGICLLYSSFIDIIGDNTNIYDCDIGIYLNRSDYININFSKTEINDLPSIYECNWGIFGDSSDTFLIENIVFAFNKFGLNTHTDLCGICDEKIGNLALCYCNDFYLRNIFIITEENYENDGIRLYYCDKNNLDVNTICSIIIKGFVSDYRSGIILEYSSSIDIINIKDNDGKTQQAIKILNSHNINIDNILFNRLVESETSKGLIIDSCYNIQIDTLSSSYGILEKYDVGIHIKNSYNLVIKDIFFDTCTIGIYIDYGPTNSLYNYNIELNGINSDNCDYGIHIYKMFDYSEENYAVTIRNSAVKEIKGSNIWGFQSSVYYGIFMEGSEVLLDNSNIFSNDYGGVWNKFLTEGDNDYHGELTIYNNNNFGGNGENNQVDVKTSGASVSCKSITTTYKAIYHTTDTEDYIDFHNLSPP